jgi:hypothetical protein
MKYLGVAVLGVGVLGTAVLHPQTRLHSTKHRFTRLIPQSISNHAVAYNTTMASNIEYLGVAVLGSAVLGTTVLHPQTTSLSTQPLFTRLIPQSISNHAVA